MKMELTEKGIASVQKELKKHYENLGDFVLLYEVNCVLRQYQSLSRIFHSKHGSILHSEDKPSNFRHSKTHSWIT